MAGVVAILVLVLAALPEVARVRDVGGFVFLELGIRADGLALFGILILFRILD